MNNMKNTIFLALLSLLVFSCSQKNTNTANQTKLKDQFNTTDTGDKLSTVADSLIDGSSEQVVSREGEKEQVADPSTKVAGIKKELKQKNVDNPDSKISKGGGALKTPELPKKGDRRIVKCVVDQKTYYAVDDCYMCPDAMTTYYDEEIKKICTTGGITGRSTCENEFLRMINSKEDRTCEPLKVLPTNKTSDF